MNLDAKLEKCREAIAYARNARSLAERLNLGTTSLDVFISAAHAEECAIAAKIDALRSRFAAESLLHAHFSFGGKSIRVTVCYPNAKCLNPWIRAPLYASLTRRLGANDSQPLTVSEPFDVDVVDYQDRTVLTVHGNRQP